MTPKRTQADQKRRIAVDRPRQLAALTSPLRLELMELFGIWGPCSIAEIAPRIGKPADSLYYHVRKLVDAGLLLRIGERATGRRPEATYQLAAREIEVPREATQQSEEITTRAIDAVLRLAGRELKTALADEKVRDDGPGRELYARRLRARLTKTDLRELNSAIGAIEKIYARAQTRSRAPRDALSLTIVMSPTPTHED